MEHLCAPTHSAEGSTAIVGDAAKWPCPGPVGILLDWSPG